jgi:transcriptional regulator with XRE-family HTH domain
MTRSNDNQGDKDRSVSRTLESLLKNFPGMAAQTFAKAAGQSTNIFEMLMRAPEYMEQAGRAGRYLKDLREVAGLTIEDLGQAINVENPDLLRAIEEGRAPITVDILFRLASFYSRNDPITFMMDFSKTYAPWLWQMLRFTGLEKLLITVERELKFINIYRSRDKARQLDNQEFEKLVQFTQQSFDLALDLIATTPSPKQKVKSESKASTSPQTPPKSAPARKTSTRATKASTTRARKAPARAVTKSPAKKAKKAPSSTRKRSTVAASKKTPGR